MIPSTRNPFNKTLSILLVQGFINNRQYVYSTKPRQMPAQYGIVFYSYFCSAVLLATGTIFPKKGSISQRHSELGENSLRQSFVKIFPSIEMTMNSKMMTQKACQQQMLMGPISLRVQDPLRSGRPVRKAAPWKLTMSATGFRHEYAPIPARHLLGFRPVPTRGSKYSRMMKGYPIPLVLFNGMSHCLMFLQIEVPAKSTSRANLAIW